MAALLSHSRARSREDDAVGCPLYRSEKADKIQEARMRVGYGKGGSKIQDTRQSGEKRNELQDEGTMLESKDG